MAMISAPVWTSEQLQAARQASIEVFRKQRMEEPLEQYLEAFDAYQSVIETLLESTVDLTALDGQLIDVVTDRNLLEALRYLPGPPISTDDLKVLADASLSPSALRSNPAAAKAVAQIVLDGLDRRRFPWVRATHVRMVPTAGRVRGERAVQFRVWELNRRPSSD